MRYLVILICIVFAYFRFTMPIVSEIHKEDVFKDVAHLWTGGLYGASFMAFALLAWVKTRYGYDNVGVEHVRYISWFYLALGLIMTFAVEVVAFIIHKP